MNPAPVPESRLAPADALKAVGIVAVLLGHAEGIGVLPRNYLFSFHIPLFFFVAGLLQKEASLVRPFPDFVLHHWRRLMVPYFVFGAVAYLPWVLVIRHFGRDAVLDVPPLQPLLGMLYGVGVKTWLRHDVALWFFPCLFLTHLLFYGLHRWVSPLPRLGLVLVCGFLGWAWGTHGGLALPWGLGPALAGLVFYGSGFALRGFRPFVVPQPLPVSLAMAGGGLVVQLAAVVANGRVDMNTGQYGNPILFYLGALGGILMWWQVGQILPPWPLIRRISRETVVIFPLHGLVFSALTGVAVLGLGVPLVARESPVAAFLSTMLALAVLLPVAGWLRHVAPWLFGGKGHRA